MTNGQLADWLDQLHSHSVYDADMLKEELPADVAKVVPTQTVAQVERAIELRGLGGEVTAPNGTILFTGYMASTAIARYRLGHDLCDSRYGYISGRGSLHRAAIALLREFGDQS